VGSVAIAGLERRRCGEEIAEARSEERGFYFAVLLLLYGGSIPVTCCAASSLPPLLPNLFRYTVSDGRRVSRHWKVGPIFSISLVRYFK
jgi:hypothetical protein